MNANLSGSLIGLSLLTGSTSLTSLISDVTIESRAVRDAKKLFTLPETTPPWKQALSTPFSAQVSAVKALKTIIDKDGTGIDALPGDVQTAFTTYKAIDRLRLLAESASAKTTGSAERASLQKTFAKGLADLQSYLSNAPSNELNLAFGTPTRTAASVGISKPDAYNIKMPGLTERRDDPIPGLTGQEQFEIRLTKSGTTDLVSVNLADGPQPPTIDSVAAAMNTAIKSVFNKNPDGTTMTDANGDPVPKYLVHFDVEKKDGKWRFSLDAPSSREDIAIQQVNAQDSLIIATGQTGTDSPTSTRVMRLDDPAGTVSEKTLAEISAIDRMATARNELSGAKKPVEVEGVEAPSTDVRANTDARAIVTDADGYSYIVGTASGDLDALRAAGSEDMFLTKMDSEGKVVWQRNLGATGSAQGAAVTLGDNGDVIVASTLTGTMNGTTTDGDMVVTRYNAMGDEQFATIVRGFGADQAKAVTVGSDGSIFVGGSSSNGANSMLVRIRAEGGVAERRTLDLGARESIQALAVDGNGDVIALTRADGNAQLRKISGSDMNTDLATIDLGQGDARALAIGPDGTIAVGGSTSAALSGTQVNGLSGGRDGFVARIDANLTSASVTYIGTGDADDVDSLAFMNGELYAGGRTTGSLGGTRRGPTDGFVSRIDLATGAVQGTTQFGRATLRTEPVRIAAAAQGATALGALGLHRGELVPHESAKLTAQTSLRAGDSFSIKVNDGTVRKITIGEDDTMTTLADRLRTIIGKAATVSTPTVSGKTTLKISMKSGNAIELVAGAAGKDALGKLGMDPQRLYAAALPTDDDPKVRPGGNYGLGLSEALHLDTIDDAKLALGKLKSASSMAQTAYRSLYWDDAKAARVDGTASYGKGSAYQQSQLANYQAALTRLTSDSASFYGF